MAITKISVSVLTADWERAQKVTGMTSPSQIIRVALKELLGNRLFCRHCGGEIFKNANPPGMEQYTHKDNGDTRCRPLFATPEEGE